MNTTLAPETIAPPKTARKPRKAWSQAQVAELVLCSTQPGFIANAEQHAKLVELGIRRKPVKATLDPAIQGLVDEAIGASLGELDEPQRTLAARYAIKILQDSLPKRAPK